VAYLLDANVFIQAKNLHYGFEICPGFWDWIVRANKRGLVYSIEKVGDELQAGADELSEWAKTNERGFFVKPDQKLPDGLARVSAWVHASRYEAMAVNAWMQSGADYYLVAQALANEHVVVTHERVDASAKKIKIPNVCDGLGVKCMSIWDVLRKEGARFVLENSAAPGAAP
jgi:hypothetical protein